MMTTKQLYDAVYKAMGGDKAARKIIENIYGPMKTIGDLDKVGRELYEKLSDKEKKDDYKESEKELNRLARGIDESKIKLPELLRKKIQAVGITKTAELCELKQPDVSAWYNGQRKWSLEKMAMIYGKLEDK